MATEKTWKVALYLRLSREDGDSGISNSISNQKSLLMQYIRDKPEFHLMDTYIDDGYSGTNFERPAFQRMLDDIHAGQVDCVIVKDVSRFGRDYIGTGLYLEREFPKAGVRFIAISDGIDSLSGYDMVLPIKNVMNEQYARDISKKVCSSIRSRQREGKFIGAFPSYGYMKDPRDHNHLIPDPVAAPVVQRIFTLYEQGMGKLSIAKVLNQEEVPCPSVYKQLQGDKYTNGRRLEGTSYWTYATIHRILKNQMYVGKMEQGRAPRQGMHGKAKRLPQEQWTIVDGTHEAIIAPDQWERVQRLLEQTARTPNFNQNVSIFAGLLRCGDCGRAMSKVTRRGTDFYCCGGYKRYGHQACTAAHWISGKELEQTILADLNHIISAIQNLQELELEARKSIPKQDATVRRGKLQAQLEQVNRRKQKSYEDFQDDVISKEEFQRYRADYQKQAEQLAHQLEALDASQQGTLMEKPWVASLLEKGKLDSLDRVTLAETVSSIKIFEDGHLEVTYTFDDDLGLLENT